MVTQDRLVDLKKKPQVVLIKVQLNTTLLLLTLKVCIFIMIVIIKEK